MKSTNPRTSYDCLSSISYWYLFITITIYPLFVLNGYFNTIYAKGIFQIYLILFVDILCLIAILIQRIRKKPITRSHSMTDKFVLGFAFVAVISAFSSSYGSNAFSGAKAWYMGAFEILLFCSVYFLIKNHLQKEPTLFYCGTLVIGVVFFIAFLQGFSLDIFHLKDGLSENQIKDYISTVGNTNIFAGLLSMVLPFLCYHGIHTKNKPTSLFIQIVTILGFDALLFASSDAGYLGVGTGLLILLGWYLKESTRQKELLSYLKLGILICLSYVCIDVCYFIFAKQMLTLSGLSKGLIHYHLEIVILPILLVLTFIIQRKNGYLGTKIFKVFIGVIFSTVAVYLIYTIINFSFDWGTKRGYIWYMALDIWKNGSLKDKLLGIGPDCFGLAVSNSSKYASYISSHWNVSIANAHNEVLQYFVTTGVIGCLFYLGTFGVSIYEFLIKNENEKLARLPFFSAVVGYFVQGLVTNPNPFTTTFLILFLAVLNKKTGESQN